MSTQPSKATIMYSENSQLIQVIKMFEVETGEKGLNFAGENSST